MRDKFVVGAESTYSPGDTGGEATHTLITNEMSAHSHDVTTYEIFVGIRAIAGGAAWRLTAAANTGNAGGGAAHENRPPYYALAFIMKT